MFTALLRVQPHAPAARGISRDPDRAAAGAAPSATCQPSPTQRPPVPAQLAALAPAPLSGVLDAWVHDDLRRVSRQTLPTRDERRAAGEQPALVPSGGEDVGSRGTVGGGVGGTVPSEMHQCRPSRHRTWDGPTAGGTGIYAISPSGPTWWIEMSLGRRRPRHMARRAVLVGYPLRIERCPTALRTIPAGMKHCRGVSSSPPWRSGRCRSTDRAQ